MNRNISFSKTITIFSAPESLWEVLKSGQLYEKAWSAKLETTWEVGSDIRFSGTWEGVDYFDKGVVQIYDELRLLKFSYWSSFWEVADTPNEYCFITFRIDTLDSTSCECTVVQDGFRDEKHYTDTTMLLTDTLAIIKLEAEKMSLASFASNVFSRLSEFVVSVDPEFYNGPFKDGWSPGQIVEHVIMSSSGLKDFFKDATSSSAPYDSNVQAIKTMMLDTKQKLKTPESLVPPFKLFDQQQHAKQLDLINREINHCIETFDFSMKCESYEVPPFGQMTVFEWLIFTVYHIERHTRHFNWLVSEQKSN